MARKNGSCGCGGKCGNPGCGPKKNYGSKRNPSSGANYSSEDYTIGLFQGAVEKGKLPPPPSTSADLQKGYAAGARIAKAKPAAVQRALGVYSATSSHLKAGETLRDAALGGSTVANPRKRRNPSLYLSEAIFDKDRISKIKTLAAKKAPSAKEWILRDERGKWSKDIQRLIDRTKEPDMRAKIKDYGMTQQDVDAQIATEIAYTALTALLADAKKRGKTRNPMTAAERKHCAHEKSEERAFASLLSKLPVGETVTLSGRRVRKLSKGYVVVDGERLTSSEAAAKIHRGR